MRAGKRIHKISFQEKVQVADAWGGLVESWTDHARAWAEIKFVSGREFVSAGAENVEASAVFRVRYISTVTESMRISWRGNLLDIVSILPIDGGVVDMEIVAKTGANTG